MFTVLLTILAALFGGSINDLGSRIFDERESASRRLERHEWLTVLLCYRVIDTTESAEVRHRCERVIERARNRASWFVDRAVQMASEEDWDASLVALIEDDYNLHGLPWERPWASRFHASLLIDSRTKTQAVAAMKRFIDRGRAEGWVKDDICFSCELPEGSYGNPNTLHGVSDLRFLRRGLPSPSQWQWQHRHRANWMPIKMLWRMKKMNW